MPDRTLLGVTGHRNIASDDAALTALTRRRLARLKRTWPAPFALLSGLAEGADRLVARVAMDELGAALITVLPMPREAYEMDFASAASRKAFARLLEAAEQVIEAPILTSGEDWRDYTEARNHQYAWAGALVAMHARVLIAVWDGKPARGRGGTAEVVGWFRRGVVPASYVPSLAEAGLAPPAHPADSTRRALLHIRPDASRATGRIITG